MTNKEKQLKNIRENGVWCTVATNICPWTDNKVLLEELDNFMTSLSYEVTMDEDNDYREYHNPKCRLLSNQLIKYIRMEFNDLVIVTEPWGNGFHGDDTRIIFTQKANQYKK